MSEGKLPFARSSGEFVEQLGAAFAAEIGRAAEAGAVLLETERDADGDFALAYGLAAGAIGLHFVPAAGFTNGAAELKREGFESRSAAKIAE